MARVHEKQGAFTEAYSCYSEALDIFQRSFREALPPLWHFFDAEQTAESWTGCASDLDREDTHGQSAQRVDGPACTQPLHGLAVLEYYENKQVQSALCCHCSGV